MKNLKELTLADLTGLYNYWRREYKVALKNGFDSRADEIISILAMISTEITNRTNDLFPNINL